MWRDRALLRPLGEMRAWSTPALALLSLLWMVGVAMSTQTIHLTLVPAVLLLWLLAVQGTKAARYGAQIAALFSLGLPLWGLAVPLLQLMTVAVNRILIFAARIPARVEGSFIHLKVGTLQVADTCAGFNFLMVGLTIGACYAFLFTEDWRTRLRIVAAAAAVSILSNWIRVFGLVVIGHVTDMKSYLMADHVVYGWLIFIGSMLVFFRAASVIERKASYRGDVVTSAAERLVPEDTDLVRRLLTSSAAAIAGPLLFFVLGLLQRPAAMPEDTPGILWGRFASANASQASWTPTFTGATAHRRSRMAMESLDLQLDRYLYAGGSEGAEMISEENRLASAEQIAAQGVVGPLDDRLRTAQEVLLRTPDANGRIAWYWYSISGSITSSPWRAKLMQLWAFFTGHSESEIVVLSAPCVSGQCREARNALYRVASGKNEWLTASR